MSHPPKDGEVYKTTCTTASVGFATCEGDGLTATAENPDGYFKEHRRYVWNVTGLAADPPAGEPEAGA